MLVGLFVQSRRKSGPPYSLKEALRTITVQKGFRAEPFAAEPLINSPVAMDWDENGRIYVAEDTGYPLDTRPTGRIVLLDDTNGDGIPDRRTIFADHRERGNVGIIRSPLRASFLPGIRLFPVISS